MQAGIETSKDLSIISLSVPVNVMDRRKCSGYCLTPWLLCRLPITVFVMPAVQGLGEGGTEVTFLSLVLCFIHLPGCGCRWPPLRVQSLWGST